MKSNDFEKAATIEESTRTGLQGSWPSHPDSRRGPSRRPALQRTGGIRLRTLFFAMPFTYFALTFFVCAQSQLFDVRVIKNIESYGWEYFALQTLTADFNRDGWPDIITYFDPLETFRTLVYFGGPNILDNKIDFILEGGGYMEMGDLNGDGLADIVIQKERVSVINAPVYDTVLVYSGCAGCRYMVDTIPSLKIVPPPGVSSSGILLSLGDFNGDDKDDLVIRVLGGDSTRRGSSGRVMIYMGKTNMKDSADFICEPRFATTSYGETRIKTADVNGDGYDDLLIGSLHDAQPPDQEESYTLLDIYFGSASFVYDALRPDQHFDSRDIAGLESFSIIDANGDGAGDLYVIANIYYGSPSGIHTTPDRVMKSHDSGVLSLLNPAFDIGDINGDGFKDFAIRGMRLGWGGTPLFIYLGGKHGLSEYPVASIVRGSDDADFGYWGVEPLGDIDGDGLNDFCTHGKDPLGPWYLMIMAGSSAYVLDAGDVPSMPRDAALAQAYPNPFHGNVMIRYRTEKREKTTIGIFNVYGEKIRSIEDDPWQGVGDRFIAWNGRNDSGVPVPPGIYFCRIDGGEEPARLKLMLY